MVLADLGRSINNALGNLARSGTSVDAAALDALLNEISMALLREDVGLKQVGRLTANVRKTVNLKELAPAQAKRLVQKAVFDELAKLVDAGHEAPKPKKGRTNIVMFVGLQGAGKTTTCTKFAVYYSRRGFKVGLVCADTFRAGAFDQLKQNAARAKIPYYGSYTEPDPVEVARAGVERFIKQGFDLIIVDTSGRHRQETELFDEMIQIGNAVKPTQTLMVLDASIGQAAESQARAFKEASGFGGIVLTKMDGHAKGGGAISAVAATGTPIAFIGTGEHVQDLETFAPQQFVGKLLGIGDLQGLMEQVQTLNLDQKSTIKNIQQGIFTLRDLRAQMTNIMKLGPLSKVASMIPGMSGLADQLGGEGGDGDNRLKKMVYMTDSMTEKELDSDGSLFEREPTRIVRVARGSGTSVQTVQELLFQQKMMAGMAKRMGGKDGFMSRMQALQSGRGGGPQMDMMRRKMQQMGIDPTAMGAAGGAGLPGAGGGMPDMSQLAGMLRGGGGGGGGMPNLGDMMNMVNQNPMLKNMMKQFGGGLG